MAWYEPESGLLVAKDLKAIDLDSDHLVYFHDQMHVYWQKLSDGYYFEWTFNEVYEKHTELVSEMIKRGIKHIFPINNLDNVPVTPLKKLDLPRIINLQEQKTYSVEKKMNGFHVQVHKKENQIKIFSEQKKDLTIAFPSLVENIKKLSDSDFVLDGELVPYDNGKTLGRNALMKFTGAVKSGKHPDDSHIKLHVWDILYLDKQITDLKLSERINFLKKIKFNNRILEIERKTCNKDKLKESIEWASKLPGSEGAVVKDLKALYSFGESSSWKKYRKLTPLNVIILKVIPKERGLFNYLVGVNATKKYLDPKYIENNKLVLGHTFNSKQKFNEGDKIQILIEEVWRHETKNGVHYSIHKPRVKGKTNESISSIDNLEDIVTSIGFAIIHSIIENQEVLVSEELARKIDPEAEGKEIEVKNFPDRFQKNIQDMIDKNQTGKFVMHHHLRGSSSHSDLRLEIPDQKYLEGITLFSPASTNPKILDKVNNEAKGVRCTMKLIEPMSWLTFEGITERGQAGATKNFPGIFTVVAKGKFKPYLVEDHRFILEFFCDKGRINKEYLKKAIAMGLPSRGEPNELKQLSGRFEFHVAHIGEHHYILFDKLKEK